MPHVCFVPLAGVRVREEAMQELGMSLPGLRDRARAIGQLPALGLLTLAGMTPEPWSVSYDEARPGDRALADRLLERRPDLVAMSALTASVEEAYGLAAELRRGGARVVLGGLHATACPDEALRHVDAVVVGEGEPVWPDVLADAREGALRRVYRARRPFDLARSVAPRFDLLGRAERPRLTLQTQRGCPLACEFCGASRLLGPFREKPAERVRDEIRAIREIAPEPLLELADDNTFAGARDAGPILDALGSAGARYFTEADWRIGEREDVLQGLASSGCVQVLVGIESLVRDHPGMGPKRAEWPRIRDAVERIQEAGVAVNGCFIVGSDGETRASLERLGAFLLESPFAEIQLTLETPFPGTALHRRLKDRGRLLRHRGWSHYTLFDVTFAPDPMGVGELEEAFRDLVREVFSPAAVARRAEIRKRTWRRTGSRTPAC